MKKAIFLLAFLTICTIAQAQLVTLRGDVAYVNDEAYARIKKEGCKTIAGTCSYEVYTLSGVRVCKARVMQQRKQNAADRSPNVYYVQYRFYEPEDATCETPFPMSVSLHATDVITELARAGVIVEDAIDEEALLDFLDTYGNTFSTKQSMPSEEAPVKPNKKKKQEDEEEVEE